MKKNIILIGMRGSGKSHMGSILAKKLHRSFLDTDQEIEKRAGKPIPKIVMEEGWEAFRDMEMDLCKELGEKEDMVISLGGGTITNAQNVIELKKNGVFIFLHVPLKELHRRLTKSKNKRPPLRPELSPWEEIRHIWNERKDIFQSSADLVFTGKDHSFNPHQNVAKNVQALIAFLKEEEILFQI